MDSRTEIDRILNLYPNDFGAARQMTTQEARSLFSIPEETDVTKENIKKAHRKLALAVHPDKNRDNIEKATAAFKIITAANEAVQQFDLVAQENQSAGLGQVAFLFNPESPFYTGALVAQLRQEFCLIAGIDIAYVAHTAKTNANVILKCLPVEEQQKWAPLITLLFPQGFVTSSKIGSNKKNAEWFQLLVDLKTLIATTPTLKKKKEDAFNEVMHTFLRGSIQKIHDTFPQAASGAGAEKQAEYKSFSDFYQAMCHTAPPDPLTNNEEFNECLDQFAMQNSPLLQSAVSATERLRAQYAVNPGEAILNSIFSDVMSTFINPSQQEGVLRYYERNVEEMKATELKNDLHGSLSMEGSTYGLAAFFTQKIQNISHFFPILYGNSDGSPTQQMQQLIAQANEIEGLLEELKRVDPDNSIFITHERLAKAIKLVKQQSPELITARYSDREGAPIHIAQYLSRTKTQLDSIISYKRKQLQQRQQKQKATPALKPPSAGAEPQEQKQSAPQNQDAALFNLAQRVVERLRQKQDKRIEVNCDKPPCVITYGVRVSDPEAFYIEIRSEDRKQLLHQLSVKDKKITSYMGKKTDAAPHWQWMQDNDIIGKITQRLDAENKQLQERNKSAVALQQAGSASQTTSQAVAPLLAQHQPHQQQQQQHHHQQHIAQPSLEAKDDDQIANEIAQILRDYITHLDSRKGSFYFIFTASTQNKCSRAQELLNIIDKPSHSAAKKPSATDRLASFASAFSAKDAELLSARRDRWGVTAFKAIVTLLSAGFTYWGVNIWESHGEVEVKKIEAEVQKFNPKSR